MPYADPAKRREWEKNRPKRDRSAYQREYGKTRSRAKSTRKVCPHGDLDIYTRPNGRTECRICKVEAARRERNSITPEQRARRNLKARARNLDRKARLKKMFIEHVDPEVLFLRDGGICGICQEPVDPLDWHIDHIIPLDPGEHSYRNTQVAHPRCNVSKGRKMILVGLGKPASHPF